MEPYQICSGVECVCFNLQTRYLHRNHIISFLYHSKHQCFKVQPHFFMFLNCCFLLLKSIPGSIFYLCIPHVMLSFEIHYIKNDDVIYPYTG